MRILVTGGAGFIGSNFCSLALNAGHNVICIDNLNTGYLANLTSEVQFEFGDITDKEFINYIFGFGIDCVVHMAASVGRQKSLDYPGIDLRVNAEGTITILEAMKKHGVKNIVFSSSAAVYGESKDEIITENHPLTPNCQYGISKLAAEMYIKIYHELYDINYKIIRYFNIFGKNQRYDAYGNVIPIFTKSALNNEEIVIYGDGSQTRDFVNVLDVVKLNLLLIDHPDNIIVNLGTGTRINILDLAKEIISSTHSKSQIKFLDKRKGDVKHCSACIDKLTNEIHFTANKDFKEDLTHYLHWYRHTILCKK